jgi:hypothetical protein
MLVVVLPGGAVSYSPDPEPAKPYCGQSIFVRRVEYN